MFAKHIIKMPTHRDIGLKMFDTSYKTAYNPNYPMLLINQPSKEQIRQNNIAAFEHSRFIQNLRQERDSKQVIYSASSKRGTPIMTVLVMGGPGCGKGTQCKKLADHFGFTHLSTGDLLRQEVGSGSETGKELAEIMQRGELVPTDLVLKLLRESMLANPSECFLIDGFPRELKQAIKFEEEVAPVDSVLFFDVSYATMRQRLLKRGETSGRADDNEETIEKRLLTFQNVTIPVISHYKLMNKMYRISAEDRCPEQIFQNVMPILQEEKEAHW